MTTAIFIDGAFFVKRLRHHLPKELHHDAKNMASIAMNMALRHLKLRQGQQSQDDDLSLKLQYNKH